ncbi:MAG: hypothetical protein SPG28_00180 [Alloprevotella sp.]|nr:hypothetical protein [Alloprevotella sp.]
MAANITIIYQIAMPCGEFDDILKENRVYILSPVSAKYQKVGIAAAVASPYLCIVIQK